VIKTTEIRSKLTLIGGTPTRKRKDMALNKPSTDVKEKKFA
jgi:hypothetical protein